MTACPLGGGRALRLQASQIGPLFRSDRIQLLSPSPWGGRGEMTACPLGGGRALRLQASQIGPLSLGSYSTSISCPLGGGGGESWWAGVDSNNCSFCIEFTLRP